MMSYNYRNGYALLSYLEYPIILIQEIVLIFCVLYFKQLLNIASLVGTTFYISIAFAFISGIVPLGMLAFLVVSKYHINFLIWNNLLCIFIFQPLCTPIGASSKVVQLVEILKSKNAESVSVLTWFISAFTNFSEYLKNQNT